MGMDEVLNICLSLLERGGRCDVPANVGRNHKMSFIAPAVIKNHKGTECHIGHRYFSNG
jgi:hypothetical protein